MASTQWNTGPPWQLPPLTGQRPHPLAGLVAQCRLLDGNSDAVARLDIAKDTPRHVLLLRVTSTWAPSPPATSLTFKGAADDGVVLRINGQVVDTKAYVAWQH